jgi:hypothetical protein
VRARGVRLSIVDRARGCGRRSVLRFARVASTLVWAASLSACATFSKDLERVRDHYERTEFTAALALLRVLEYDRDALSPRERVEYSYLRGMTDYRLAAISPTGPTREEFRRYAKQYLDEAKDLDRSTPGALGTAEEGRLTDALAALAEGDTPPLSTPTAQPPPAPAEGNGAAVPTVPAPPSSDGTEPAAPPPTPSDTPSAAPLPARRNGPPVTRDLTSSSP